MNTLFQSLVLISSALMISQNTNAQHLERKYLQNQSYTYPELKAAYTQLAESSSLAQIITFDETDAGVPIELFKISKQTNLGEPTGNELKILVMNGIHAGESCGIDASLHWAENLLQNPELIGDATIYIIPAYNIGGSMNRSCCTRANQNGPELMGFRGNANNLDLNRDFMKMDSKNSRVFRQVLYSIQPDIFVDTHSTNGADYQYRMTLIPYQSEKWPKPMRAVYNSWFAETMQTLNNEQEQAQYYVNVWGKTPENGFSAFHATSIFSTGFTGLYRTFGITAEAHMFKPYPERVEATMQTLDAVLAVSLIYQNEIINTRKQALEADLNLERFPINWALDSTDFKEVPFRGYAVDRFTSKLTQQPRYRFNRERPVVYTTKFYPTYKPTEWVDVPNYYVLKKGQFKAIENLIAGNAEITRLPKDTMMAVSVQYVEDITFSNRPYEGHFPHRSFTLRSETVTEQFFAGDVLISTKQSAIRFILEALEPQSPGSFFKWNYFDTYVQQKEWFSSYIFEDKAVAFLEENPEIKTEFEGWKSKDETAQNSASAQLYWIYKRMPYYEKEHMRIPVFRVY